MTVDWSATNWTPHNWESGVVCAFCGYEPSDLVPIHVRSIVGIRRGGPWACCNCVSDLFVVAAVTDMRLETLALRFAPFPPPADGGFV